LESTKTTTKRGDGKRERGQNGKKKGRGLRVKSAVERFSQCFTMDASE